MFVCYAHSDADSVYADLVELRNNGVNIWYDEGIPAGSSWRGEIAALARRQGLSTDVVLESYRMGSAFVQPA